MIKHIGSYLKKSSYKLFAYKGTHLLLSVGLFYIFFILFRYGSLTEIDTYGFRYNYFVAFIYGAMMVFFIRTYNAYLLGYIRVRTLVFGQFLAQLLSIIILYFRGFCKIQLKISYNCDIIWYINGASFVHSF